ncbi:MAG: hypothetical protein KDB07_11450, partial [Planctomycetes bacterium]|nr:hypothetical protein [Planctomycetota bacterium]
FVTGQTPTSPQIINDNFTGQIEYVDADGNRDLDSTDTITVSFNANTINNPGGGTLAATSGLVDFSGGNALNIDGIGRTDTLTFADDAGGSAGGPYASLTVASFVLQGDATTILTEVSAPANINSTAAYQTLWQVEVDDQGSGDAEPTIVNSITFTITPTGGFDTSNFMWRLQPGNLAPSATTATTVTFSAAPIVSVADGGASTLTLEAQTTVTNSTTLDSIDIDVDVVAAQVTTDAAGSRMNPAASADNTTDTNLDVIATTMVFLTTPSSPQLINNDFAARIAFQDAAGNRDTSAVNTVTVTFNGNTFNTGASVATTSGLIDWDGADPALSIQGPGATNTLTFTDDVAGINLSGSPLTVAGFVLQGDADATFTQNSRADMNSTAAFQAIWVVNINDAGTMDAVPTIIDEVTYTVTVSGGTYDATDFTWRLQPGDVAPTAVTATTVAFTGGTNLLTVANTGSGTLTLEAQTTVTGSTTLDGIDIDLDLTNASFSLDAAGSRLVAAQTLDNSVDTNVDVVSTELRMITQPANGAAPGHTLAGTELETTAFDVVVEYTDATGNRDLGVNGDVVSAVRWDTNTMALEGGAVQQGDSAAAVNGVASFTAANLIDLGGPGNITNDLALRLTDDAGNSIDISGAPRDTNNFLLVDDDDADTTIAETDLGAVATSSAAMVSVFQLLVTDTGLSDALPTIVNQVVFHINVTGGNEPSAWNWQLMGLGAVAVVNDVADTVTFTAAPLQSIANGGNYTFVLQAQLATTNNTTIDNDTFDVTVATADITTAGGGTSTSIAAAQTVNDVAQDGTVSITATQMAFVGATPTMAATGAAPSTINVVVHYIDADGNRDTDVT